MEQNGKYFNGETPIALPVKCFFHDGKLFIYHAETKEEIAVWEGEDLFQDAIHNTAIVLGNKKFKAKIELLDAKKIEGIGFQLEQPIKRQKHIFFLWIFCLFGICLASWLSIPVITKELARRIPFEAEKKYSAHIPLSNHFNFCTLTAKEKHALESYVHFLYPLNSEEKKMPIEISVANNPMVNAFTFPGGRIILMRGLIREVKSPSELLGVLSHEIGHVTNRDSAGLLVRGTLVASFFGFLTGDYSGTFTVSPQLFLSTVALSFDRDMEKMADALAVKRLNHLEVSTSGLRSFFSRRLDENISNIPEILQTHPAYKNRIEQIKETYPKKDFPDEITSGWEIVKNICQSSS